MQNCTSAYSDDPWLSNIETSRTQRQDQTLAGTASTPLSHSDREARRRLIDTRRAVKIPGQTF
ncbi:hypothetical protein M404DRAFT_1000434, partial [Pisolithus tinctorius Marx 270]